MASTTVQLHSLPSLGALTLKLYPRSGGAIVNGGAGDALTESGSTPGLYAATVTEALSGMYAARVYSGADLLGSYLVDLRDDTGAYDLADPAIAVGASSLAAEEIAAEVEGGDGGGEVTGFSEAALSQLAGITIRVSQPFRGPGEALEIVHGDDYADVDGRAIEITVTGLDDDLDLSSAAGHMSLKLGSDVVTFTATDISDAGDDVVLRFEPSASDTSALRVSRNWKYDVQITLASGRKITPITEAEAVVLASYSE
jgi:hypothetical protein